MSLRILAKKGIVLLALYLCLSLPGLAQSGLGAIVGTVKDGTGAVIPGVTVALSNPGTIGGNQQAFTNESGSYRFLRLVPGSYKVSAELPGFQTTVRGGVLVNADVNARVDLVLEVGSVTDVVNVTTEEVLLDTTTTLHQTVLDRTMIDAMPLRTDMWSIAKTIPGLILSRTDVAGDASYNQANITVHGANQSREGAFTMDGFEFGSASAGGGDLAMYVPPSNYQEVNYQGGNASAENQRGGMVYNFVTRTGTNTVHGDFSFSGSRAGLQSENLTPALRQDLLAAIPAKVLAANPDFDPSAKILSLYDSSLAVTGPIIKDRLWFSATGFLGQLNQLKVGSYNPDGTRYVDDNAKKDWSMKLSLQLTPNQQLHVYHEFNQKLAKKFRAKQFTDTAATTCQCPNAKYFETVKWVGTMTPNLVLEAGASLFHGANTYTPQGSVGPGAVPYQDAVTLVYSGAATGYGNNPNQRSSAIANLSYLNRSHELKIGYQYVGSVYHTRTYDVSNYPSGLLAVLRNGVPDSVKTYNTPTNFKAVEHNHSIYVQDKWRLTQKLTMNYGLRLSQTTNFSPPACQPETVFIAGRCYDEVDPPDFLTLSPRIALVYDVFGNGRTALKMNASKYDVSLGNPYVTQISPLAVANDTRPWTDANQDLIPQLSELGTSTGYSSKHNRYNPDLKRPYTVALSAEVEHQLPGEIKVTVGFYHHSDRQTIGYRNLLVPRESYIPLMVTEASSGQQVLVYNQDPTTKGQFDNLYDNYSEMDGHFNGVDISVAKRLSNRWMVNGGASFGRNVGDTLGPGSDLNNPNFVYRRGPLSTDVPASYKATGLYQLPFGIDLSASAQYTRGFPENQTVSVGKTTVKLTQTTQVVDVEPQGTTRLPSIGLLDLSIRRTFKLNEKVTAKPVIDILNIGNVSTITGRATQLGPTFGRVSSILRGRTIRMGLSASF
jgi:Carboxypeptidase regulatory-like domain